MFDNKTSYPHLRHLWIVSLMCIHVLGFSQMLEPQARNFTNMIPGIGIQNWAVATSKLSGVETLYVGNSSGLITFNGNDWNIHYPSQTAAIHDISIKGDLIYTAGNNNIGFWQYDETNHLTYTSLLGYAEELGIDYDDYWHIASNDSLVYFHSFSNIITWNGHEMKFLAKKGHFNSLLQNGQQVFTQKRDGTVWVIEGHKIELFCDKPELMGSTLKFICQLPNGCYLLGLEDGTVYKLAHDTLTLTAKIRNNLGNPILIECGTLYDSLLLVGTMSNGVLIYDTAANRQIIFDITHLFDRNVHSLAYDSQGLVWGAMDYGVSAIDLFPQNAIWKKIEDIGIFFDAASYADDTWIITNRGLFLYGQENNTPQFTDFYPLKVTQAKGDFLFGATNGLYRFNPDEKTITKISEANGISQFDMMSIGEEDWLVGNGFSGLSYLRYDGGKWQFHSTIGTPRSYTSIIAESPSLIWGLRTDGKLERVRISQQLDRIIGSDTITEIDGHGDFSRLCLFKLNNNVYFSLPQGVYTYDLDSRSFRKSNWVSQAIANLPSVKKIEGLSPNKIVCSTDSQISFYTYNGDSLLIDKSFSLYSNPLLEYGKELKHTVLNDSLSILSTQGGIEFFDTRIRNQVKDSSFIVSTIYYYQNDKPHYLNPKSNLNFASSAKDLTFEVARGIDALDTYFSYRLSEDNNVWTNWQKSGIISFAMLPSDDYELEIRDNYGQILKVNFTIATPFWKSVWAYIIYALIIICIGSLVTYLLQQRKHKHLLTELDEEKEIHQQDVERQEMEMLQLKIKEQENELKNNLRFLTQKQELLEEITAEVEKQKEELGERWPNIYYDRLKKIINAGASETDKVLSFENYFVEIQKDFMTVISQKHPDLTHSELRLCCLLRSNLSTKEIAAVMGIAPRSVELKKYRMKKKLALNEDSESSLNAYIMSL